jgi:hypothetical protein
MLQLEVDPVPNCCKEGLICYSPQPVGAAKRAYALCPYANMYACIHMCMHICTTSGQRTYVPTNHTHTHNILAGIVLRHENHLDDGIIYTNMHTYTHIAHEKLAPYVMHPHHHVKIHTHIHTYILHARSSLRELAHIHKCTHTYTQFSARHWSRT